MPAGWAAPDLNPPPGGVASTSTVLRIEANRGRILVPARVNGSEPRWFLLDTGYSLTMMNPDLVETLGLRRAGRVTIVGIAGEEEAATYEGANFDFGGATYSPRRIASLPSESSRRWRRRDGILGSGFFRRFVIEVDPQGKEIKLHEPKSYQYAGKGEVIPLRFRRDTPIIEAAVKPPEGAMVSGRFEVDTGCDSGLCLGHDFVVANKLDGPAGTTRDSVRQGVGGGARTTAGHLSALQLGRLVVTNAPANFFQEGSPVDRDLAGHIGMEILRRFKIIFDYSRQQMILEPYR